ncbi:hypothetical protein FNV43_RR18972 [Rhamnella rubrinervis]|uniref:TAFII-230 TBP-binding domain-containing protein n=1 Tax=Rhamnella rubrinervis TaxID=2594499 RepID=A0A8K0E658_9ROSA|nr:hypothetical protein FNV43_RR18972 [Rhamnella rubrinervis]
MEGATGRGYGVALVYLLYTISLACIWNQNLLYPLLIQSVRDGYRLRYSLYFEDSSIRQSVLVQAVSEIAVLKMGEMKAMSGRKDRGEKGWSIEGGGVDDEEEYDDVGGGNRFLGFMFGNVDNSGDLDVDYLDEDAKEHLAALADKLGSSLTDIDLSVKSPQTSTEVAEQGDVEITNCSDLSNFSSVNISITMPFVNASYSCPDYDEKAEDAVDYEDIEEQSRDQRFKLLAKRTICCPKRVSFRRCFIVYSEAYSFCI